MSDHRRLRTCAVVVSLLAVATGACSSDDQAQRQNTSTTDVPVQGDPKGAANSGAGGDSGAGGGGQSVDPQGSTP